jgi:NDP-sugar pyrophosphorylase family protein
MEPNLVILAGGVSSRMRREGPGGIDPRLARDADEKSKGMIGIGKGHRPFMDYLLYNAREAGYRDVVIVVGENDTSFREHYGGAERGNDFHGLTISYTIQRIPAGRRKPLGTADALLQALHMRPDWHGGKFTVCNSDNLYSEAALRLLLKTTAPSAMIGYDLSALQFSRERIQQFAVIKKDRDGFLVDIIEKPSSDEFALARDAGGLLGVSMNIFRFSYERILPFLECVPLHPERLEKELPVAVRLMAAQFPRSIAVIPLAEYVPDLTSREDIKQVQEYLRREYPDLVWRDDS